jgi:predicted hydrocarbon binding protein
MRVKPKKLSTAVIERLLFMKKRRKTKDRGILALQIIEKGMGFVSKPLAYEAGKLLGLKFAKDEMDVHYWMYCYHRPAIRKNLILNENSVFFQFKSEND